MENVKSFVQELRNNKPVEAINIIKTSLSERARFAVKDVQNSVAKSFRFSELKEAE